MLDHQVLRLLIRIWWSAEQHEVSFFFVPILVRVLVELFIFVAQFEIGAVSVVVHESAHHLLSLARRSHGGGRLVVFIVTVAIGFDLCGAIHRIRLRLQEICWVARNSDLGDGLSEALRPRVFPLHHLLMSSFATLGNVKSLSTSSIRTISD